METALNTNLLGLNQSVDVKLGQTIVLEDLTCPICSRPWIAVGNLLAGVFQEYMQDCTCKVENM